MAFHYFLLLFLMDFYWTVKNCMRMKRKVSLTDSKDGAMQFRHSFSAHLQCHVTSSTPPHSHHVIKRCYTALKKRERNPWNVTCSGMSGTITTSSPPHEQQCPRTTHIQLYVCVPVNTAITIKIKCNK